MEDRAVALFYDRGRAASREKRGVSCERRGRTGVWLGAGVDVESGGEEGAHVAEQRRPARLRQKRR